MTRYDYTSADVANATRWSVAKVAALRSGRRRPSVDDAFTLADASGGEVSVVSWRAPRELRSAVAV